MSKEIWKIKKEIIEGKEKGLLKAIQALLIMMDIGIADAIFREFADKNPDFYKWFSKS